jgi:hypothetical protein
MKTIESIERVSFIHDQIRKHWGYDKNINRSSNELVSELARDFADPTKDYFPFLFY